ncbi:BT4734/BF3469 family protein [Hallella absiana]|uniref:BT4734/BF3469 family protein n=1 Tax=Hallella absiana TaxID=2925336 RepID=UPI0021CA92E5|nr:BT4734/BF3469 family protein [Hallella absiana]
MFDYIQNIRSHHTVPCTAEILHTVMRSTIVGQTCAEIADCHEQLLRGEMSREDFETKKTELKKRLPAFCFHAHFKNGRRLNAEAIASGLSILDIDHIKGSPEVFFHEKVKDRVKELGIVLAHKTPSGEGLRLVFIIPQGMGLVEAQQWLAKQIGLEAFDEACKDLARCSFAVPEEYVLFLDEEELFKEPQQPHPQPLSKGEGSDMLQDTLATTNNAAAITPAEHSQPHPRPLSQGEGSDMLQDTTASTNNAAAITPAEHSTPLSLGEGSGVRLLFVFDLCREQAGLKDVDINARGSRHNSLLAILSVGAARLLSEAEAMAVVERRMPEFYKEPDCRQLIHDFYAKYHDDSKIMSATVQRINARAEQLAQRAKEKQEDSEEEEEDSEDSENSFYSGYRSYSAYSSYSNDGNDKSHDNIPADIPPIPGLKQSLTGVPEQMRMPALCALLPMAAAYADDVTFRYCDGREQRLGLMSIVVGEQASGKSVCKDIIDLWRQPMDEDDEQGRRKEDEWKKKRKNRRANEKLDPEPEVLIRDVPITISCSTLLKRLKNAQGHTLYSFCSELDTLRKTNGAGSWSSKYDIYRLAFDHDEWGQDYNSDQAESGMVSVGYNWTILGTYGALGKCFKGENIENGLSSRIIVSEMPDSAFAPMPTFQDRRDRDAQAILDAVGTLRAKHGYVDTPRLRKAIAQWVEDKRQQALQRIDRVMDTYRRRAAVIGMRCGVVACLLSGEKETKHVIDFALMMAEYVLQEQCRLFGDVLRKQYAADADDTRRNSKNRAVFDRLADTFTSHDILALKNDVSDAAARMIIKRWREAGWVETLPRQKGDKGQRYKKVKRNTVTA